MLILSKLITIIIVLTIAFTTILQPQAKNTKQSLFVYYSPEQKSHVNTRYTTHVLQLHKWREYNHTRVFVPHSPSIDRGGDTWHVAAWRHVLHLIAAGAGHKVSRHSRVTLAILSLNLSIISGQNRQNGLKQSKLGQKESKWMWHKNRIASEGSWRGYLNFYVCGPRVLRGVVRSRISEDTAPRRSDTAATTQQQQSQLCLSVYCKESSFQIRFVHNFSIHLLLFLLK